MVLLRTDSCEFICGNHPDSRHPSLPLPKSQEKSLFKRHQPTLPVLAKSSPFLFERLLQCILKVRSCQGQMLSVFAGTNTRQGGKTGTHTGMNTQMLHIPFTGPPFQKRPIINTGFPEDLPVLCLPRSSNALLRIHLWMLQCFNVSLTAHINDPFKQPPPASGTVA